MGFGSCLVSVPDSQTPPRLVFHVISAWSGPNPPLHILACLYPVLFVVHAVACSSSLWYGVFHVVCSQPSHLFSLLLFQVICEKAEASDVPNIDKKKYLVPADLTVGQFVYVIRKRISLPQEKAIFVFVNNSLPPTASLMSEVYEKNKDADGFLYITYSGENTFGSDEC